MSTGYRHESLDLPNHYTRLLAARYLDNQHIAHNRGLDDIDIEVVTISKRIFKSPQARGELMQSSMAAARSCLRLVMRRRQSYLRMKGCCRSCVAVQRFLGSCSTCRHKRYAGLSGSCQAWAMHKVKAVPTTATVPQCAWPSVRSEVFSNVLGALQLSGADYVVVANWKSHVVHSQILTVLQRQQSLCRQEARGITPCKYLTLCRQESTNMCSSREASWLSVGRGDWFVILSSRSQKLGAWPFCRHAHAERG